MVNESVLRKYDNVRFESNYVAHAQAEINYVRLML
jgi:hypothetical protein